MLLTAIVLVPLLGAAINGLVGVRRFSRQVAGVVACAAMAGSFALSVWSVAQLLSLPASGRVQDVVVASWIPPIALATANGIGAFSVDWALRLDPLSAVMVLVVTGIGLLIHVYSTAYMQEEPPGAYARFFAYLNLFCFFMLTLVLGANFV